MDKTFYFEINNETLALSTGEAISTRPKLVYGVKTEKWSINILNNAATVDVSDATSWIASMDKDFNPTTYPGVLTADKTGAITEVKVGSMAVAPPAAGFLVLTNGSAESDTIYYSSWTYANSVYTFVVGVTLDYAYVIGEAAIAMLTPPMVRVLNAGIDGTSAATGILVVTMNSMTWPFWYAVLNLEEVAAYFELKGYVSGDLKYWFKFPVRACSQVDPGAGSPGNPPGLFPTWPELESGYEPISTYVQALCNFKTAQENVVGIVPTGKLGRPIRGESLTMAITGAAALPTLKWKADSADLMTATLALNMGVVYGADIYDFGGVTWYPAGTVFYCEVTNAGTSTTHTGKNILKLETIDA